MLFILSPLYALWSMVDASVLTSINHASLFLLRVPIVFADIGILLVLVSWFKRYQKRVLILYWASPVLFYISYIHGQLDAIPIFFLFAFLYALVKEYDYLALILLGFAIAAKTGMVVILPLVVVYLYKERKGSPWLLFKIIIPCIVFTVVTLPVLFSKGFIETVLKTKEGFKVFDLTVLSNTELVLYIVPVASLLSLFYFATFKRYSRDVFVSFLAFSFFVLILCIPPRQGWYFWIIPFAVYFYVQKPWREWFPFYFLTGAYFVYFSVIEESDFLSVFSSLHAVYPSLYWYGIEYGLPMDTIPSLVFSFLQAMVLLNIYIIYRDGIAFYTRRKLYYKPFLLAIAGDSGSGKTTLSELLSLVFSTRNTTIIAGDDMHKWERGDSNWQDYTHLDPLANELHADIENVYKMKKGESVMRRHYDHSTGKFTEPKEQLAKRLVIFEGLHSLFLDKLRKAFDVKIYVSPEEQLRLHWKIIRDKEKRGHSKEEILSTLEKRKDDSENFIAVQEKHSDIVISLRNAVSLGKQLGHNDVELSLSLFMSCANSVHLQPLLDELVPSFKVDYLIHDDKQRVKCTGNIQENEVRMIAEKVLPEIDLISTDGGVWVGGYHGVMQLFVTYYIFQTLIMENYDK